MNKSLTWTSVTIDATFNRYPSHMDSVKVLKWPLRRMGKRLTRFTAWTTTCVTSYSHWLLMHLYVALHLPCNLHTGSSCACHVWCWSFRDHDLPEAHWTNGEKITHDEDACDIMYINNSSWAVCKTFKLTSGGKESISDSFVIYTNCQLISFCVLIHFYAHFFNVNVDMYVWGKAKFKCLYMVAVSFIYLLHFVPTAFFNDQLRFVHSDSHVFTPAVDMQAHFAK